MGRDQPGLAAHVEAWLARFEDALSRADAPGIERAFLADGYWRDLVAFTWGIATVRGAREIAAALAARHGEIRATGFRLDRGRAAPRRVTRAGREALEAFLTFRTARGRAEGVVRLVPDPRGGEGLCAWTLLTALDALDGFEERVGPDRPTGDAFARDFSGPNWLDRRREASAYASRDPAALVVGGGQAGLSIAARLTQLGVDTLIVDRLERIGDNWRTRYHALTLHNQVQVNHLPYMPFPPTWPAYIPKDKLAGWFECYVEAMELNYWPGTELVSAARDARDGCWDVTLAHAGGGRRRLRPRHVVMATGLSGPPRLPEIPTLESFSGTVLHSSAYDVAEPWAGRHAVVVGSGNSGHDVAQDLHAAGASVTMVQRSPTLVVNIEPSAQLPYALYDEGPPLEDCDLVAASMPFALARRAHAQMTDRARELDRDLLARLEDRGFRLDFGEDDTGWQFKYLTRGGGYYFNVGCSDLIAAGEIGLVQLADVDRFVSDGIRTKGGDTVPADLVVLATGYLGQDAVVRKLFGAEVADRIGPIWGFDERDELRNMFVRTAEPGLWFIAGSLAQCRIFSKYLGLQIKACEEGLIAP